MERKLSWPKEPYRGLAYYEAEDALLFAGREHDVEQCVHYLAEPQTRLLILHGRTGCGKSSFLRAGLIPTLEERGFAFQFLRRPCTDSHSADAVEDSPPVFIRCGPDPLRRIAEEIYRLSSQPLRVETVLGPRQIDLRKAIAGHSSVEQFVDSCKDHRLLLKVFKTLSGLLLHTLVIILDQAEEVLTLTEALDDRRRRFFRFLQEFLTKSVDLKFVLALRKEHFGEFFGLVQLDASLRTDVKQFLLTDMTRNQVERAILLPTDRTEIPEFGAPYSRYRFEYQPGVAGRIVEDLFSAVPSGGALPVMQIVCRDLYNEILRTPQPWIIDETLYAAGDGVTGRVGKHLTNSLQAALRETTAEAAIPDAEAGWRQALTGLVRRDSDGTTTTDFVSASRMNELLDQAGVRGDRSAVLERLTRPDMLILRSLQLLTVEQLKEETFYSLGHDAVGLALQEWKVRDAEERKRREAERTVRIRTRWGIVAAATAVLATLLAWYLSIESTFNDKQLRIGVLTAAAERYARTNLNLAASAAVEAAFEGDTLKRWPHQADTRGQSLLHRLLAQLPAAVIPSPFDQLNPLSAGSDTPDDVRVSLLPQSGSLLFVEDSGQTLLVQNPLHAGSQVQVRQRFVDIPGGARNLCCVAEAADGQQIQFSVDPDVAYVSRPAAGRSEHPKHLEASMLVARPDGTQWECNVGCFLKLSTAVARATNASAAQARKRKKDTAGPTDEPIHKPSLILTRDGVILWTRLGSELIAERFELDGATGGSYRATGSYTYNEEEFFNTAAFGNRQAQARYHQMGPFFLVEAVIRRPAQGGPTDQDSIIGMAGYDLRKGGTSPAWTVSTHGNSQLSKCNPKQDLGVRCRVVTPSSRITSAPATNVFYVRIAADASPDSPSRAYGDQARGSDTIVAIDAQTGAMRSIDLKPMIALRRQAGNPRSSKDSGSLGESNSTSGDPDPGYFRLMLGGSLEHLLLGIAGGYAIDIFYTERGTAAVFIGTALSKTLLDDWVFTDDERAVIAASRGSGLSWDMASLQAAGISRDDRTDLQELVRRVCTESLSISKVSRFEWYEGTGLTDGKPPDRCARSAAKPH